MGGQTSSACTEVGKENLCGSGMERDQQRFRQACAVEQKKENTLKQTEIFQVVADGRFRVTSGHSDEVQGSARLQRQADDGQCAVWTNSSCSALSVTEGLDSLLANSSPLVPRLFILDT